MRKKDKFGKYEIQYDTILDHDIFEYLRVSFEVPRENNREEAIMSLNGVPIGIIRVVREAGKIKGYWGARIVQNIIVPVNGGLLDKKLGKIAAMMVSDLVK